MAIKGIGSFDASQPVRGPTSVDVTVNGRKISRGVQLYTIAVSVFKSETYAWLRLDQPLDGQDYPAGYIHLPQGVDAEWLQQLVAEQLVTVKNKRTGRTRQEWQKSRARNEAIDCRVYARAAAYALRLDSWSRAKWDRATGLITTHPVPAAPLMGEPILALPAVQAPSRAAAPAAARVNPITGRSRGSFLTRR